MVRWWLVPILLLLLVALGLFVRGEPAPGFDRAVGEAVRAEVPGDMHGVMEATTKAIYRPWNMLIGLALAGVAWLARGWRSGLLVLLAMGLVLLAVEGIKPAFGRLRPAASASVSEARSPRSYVSGHVAWTAGTLGAFALAMTRRRRTRLTALLAAGLATVWMTTSRIYLGKHYLSDALGSVLLASAIVLALHGLLLQGADPGSRPTRARDCAS